MPSYEYGFIVRLQVQVVVYGTVVLSACHQTLRHCVFLNIHYVLQSLQIFSNKECDSELDMGGKDKYVMCADPSEHSVEKEVTWPRYWRNTWKENPQEEGSSPEICGAILQDRTGQCLPSPRIGCDQRQKYVWMNNDIEQQPDNKDECQRKVHVFLKRARPQHFDLMLLIKGNNQEVLSEAATDLNQGLGGLVWPTYTGEIGVSRGRTCKKVLTTLKEKGMLP